MRIINSEIVENVLKSMLNEAVEQYGEEAKETNAYKISKEILELIKKQPEVVIEEMLNNAYGAGYQEAKETYMDDRGCLSCNNGVSECNYCPKCGQTIKREEL